MRIITLTTDFGGLAEYVGVMKGVILSIAPDVQLVDLTHNISPQDIRETIYILTRATPYFPGGTIHLVVVDPGVGSQRRPILVEATAAHFVGPDNGIFTTALAQPAARAWHLDRPEYWLPNVSQTFHGRDIFAPIAAHLANDVPPARLGHPIADPRHFPVSGPGRTGDGSISGQVVFTDGFGNLITDIPGAWVAAGAWVCELAGQQVALYHSYVEAAPGQVMALVSSGSTVEIAVREGNAARALGVKTGARVILRSASRKPAQPMK